MSKKLTISEIQEKSNLIHNNKYDYSKFNYVNNKTKSIIICPIHGEFEQNINNHLSLKQGCPECKKVKLKEINTKSYNDFVKELNNKFSNDFIILEDDFKGYSSKCKFTCNVHGNFYITPYNILKSKYGCNKCARCLQETNALNIEDFIEKSKNIHNDFYNYNKSIYKNNRIKTIITCNKHGDFLQTPMNHLTGSGCPKCSNSLISKEEINIYNFLNDIVKCESSNRNVLKSGELDIYIPELKMAIEYNGLYWHSYKFRKDKNYHLNKTLQTEKEEIKLIHIFEDEWIYKKEIVKSRLLNLIGKTPNKIYARKCKIREISYKEGSKFLETNHIQGNVVSKYRIGLFYNNELVSLMTFGGLRKNLGSTSEEGKYELLRFCNKLNTSVVGGASKLLSYFEKTYKPKEIISYADRRWSSGNLYKQLKFKFVSNSSPNYFYVNNNKRENRFKYRKSELVKQGFDKNKTEKQIMEEQGFHRIYDCGNMKFIKLIQKYSEETLF